jgi:hypothetical protein
MDIAPGEYPSDLNAQEQIVKHMVNRFLNWRLPDDFQPDGGITYTKPNHPDFHPIGTNLFTATQAEEMVRHMLEDAPNFEHKTPNVKLEPETDIRDALKSEVSQAADYLYTIKGHVDPELRKGIDMTRQLINECFVHEGKSISNQYLYDRIAPMVEAQKTYHFAFNSDNSLTLKWPSELSLKEAIDTTRETMSRIREQAQQELLDELERTGRSQGWMNSAAMVKHFINSKRIGASKDGDA